MGLKYIWFFVILLAFVSPSKSIDRTADYMKSDPKGNSLNENQWAKLKKNYKYKIPKADSTTHKENSNQGGLNFSGFQWLEILAYAGVFFLIGFIIYLLVRFGFFGDSELKKSKILINTQQETDDINELDIEPLLKAALDKKDYKLATRLRFLSLLQLLNQKKFIQWERYNTNRSYIQQLRGSKFELSFHQICTTYEMVWYGNYAMDESQYHRVSGRFEAILSSVIPAAHV